MFPDLIEDNGFFHDCILIFFCLKENNLKVVYEIFHFGMEFILDHN